ncbi:MAG: hypothetical protein HKM94_05640, partial [Halobacteria archaeon]|nr:hypothetical protein [Halobacteria archaeon]
TALMAEEADALQQFWSNPVIYTPPGGESLTRFQERIFNAWQETTHNHPRQRILWVTHGGVIRIILCKVRQQPIAKLLQIEVRHAALYQVCISDCADAAGDAELIVDSSTLSLLPNTAEKMST